MAANRETHVRQGEQSGSLKSSGTLTCPVCGSPSVLKLPRRRRPDAFVIRAPRQCDACETVFVPPSGLLWRWFGVAVGVIACIVIFWAFVMPSSMSLLKEGWSLWSVVYLTLGLCSIPYFGRIAYVCFRSGKATVLDLQDDP